MTIESNTFSIMNNKNTQKQDSLLRHIVLFKFKEDTTKEDLTAIENAFAELPAKIPEIVDFEWGTNNSPEGLDKGFTHSFFVSFKDEKGREVYLPHPDHKAFVELAGPSIELGLHKQNQCRVALNLLLLLIFLWHLRQYVCPLLQ